MPQIKSAQKRVLVNERKHLRNQKVLSQIKTIIKKIKDFLLDKNIAQAQATLRDAYSVIDRAMCKKIIHKNQAARKKARLALKVKNQEILSEKN